MATKTKGYTSHSLLLLTCVLTLTITMTNAQNLANKLPPGFTPSPEMLKKYANQLPPGFKIPDSLKEQYANKSGSSPSSASSPSGGSGSSKPKATNPSPVLTPKARSGPCALHPWQPDLPDKLRNLAATGARSVHLNLRLHDYNHTTDPLRKPGHVVIPPSPDPDPSDPPGAPNTPGAFTYNLNRWVRVFNTQGQTLLGLSVAFDVLSVYLLDVGVERLDVPLVEEFPGCFIHLPDVEKLAMLQALVARDFQLADKPPSLEEDHYVCNQLVTNSSGHAQFSYRCCYLQHGRLVCEDEVKNEWLDRLYILIALSKLFFLLFGPWYLQRWLYTDSINKSDYVLRLSEPLRKTLLVKKVQVPDHRLLSSNINQQREMKQFKRFRRLVKDIRSDEVVNVAFSKLHILVDHRKLISEHNLPVGLMHFVWTKFFLCGFKDHEPFKSCCQESIFGSWAPRFLWFPLMQKFYCNLSWRQSASWGHLFNMLGILLLMLAIPLPYYIRLYVYYEAEEVEMLAREKAIEQLGLDPALGSNLLQYWSPSHGAMILIYVLYIACFLLLVLFRACNNSRFDNLVFSALQDMRNVSRAECVRLLLAHLVLPLEKFGLCGGLIVGVVYWPLCLPICAVVVLAYSVPTLYMTGRLLIHSRPYLLSCSPRRQNVRQPTNVLSDGVDSFEGCLMLPSISPRPPHATTSPSKHHRRPCTVSLQIFCSNCSVLLTGFVCLIWMLTVLIIYAECFGTIVEIITFCLMGAVINASSTVVNYIILVFWMIIYIVFSYNRVYKRYISLNKKLFAFIKESLRGDIKEVLKTSKDENTAYKLTPKCNRAHDEVIFPQETIDYVNGKLHWDTNHLVFFLSKQDVPRIPKALFRQICELKVPASPGPVHVALLHATRQVIYILIYLLLVFIAFMTFQDAYVVSTTNQMLVYLAAGCLPLIFLVVLKPHSQTPSLDDFTFEGKIQGLISAYRQSWPVYDLAFEQVESADLETATDIADAQNVLNAQRQQRAGRSTVTDTPDIIEQHVDLFITIKDEPDDAELGENLRSEPASFGSRLSLHSGTRTSPDTDPLHHQSVSHITTGACRSVSVQACMGKGSSGHLVGAGVGGRGSGGAVGRASGGSPLAASASLASAKSVDLVVDISRGGLPQVATSKNDSPLQLMPGASASYRKITNNDESSL